MIAKTNAILAMISAFADTNPTPSRNRGIVDKSLAPIHRAVGDRTFFIFPLAEN